MNGRSRFQHRGFTLLEVLLALSLSGVVIVLAGRLAVDAVTTRQAIEAKLESERPLANAMDQFKRDWQNRYIEEVDVYWDTHHRPVVVMQSLCGFADEGIHLPQLPSEVTYRLVAEWGGDSHLQWTRTVRNRSDQSAAPRTTVILNGIRTCEVMVHDGEAWREVDEQTDVHEKFKALRLHLVTDESELVRTFLVDWMQRQGTDDFQ